MTSSSLLSKLPANGNFHFLATEQGDCIFYTAWYTGFPAVCKVYMQIDVYNIRVTHVHILLIYLNYSNR